jgi:rhomboid protease GluP
MHFLRQAPVSTLLLVVIAAVYLAEVAAGGSTNDEVLARFGANVPALVWQGELWRLAASMFLHIGPIHVLVNGWALSQIAPLVEALLGARRLLLLFFVTGLCGSLASVLWRTWRGEPNALSAGASGALFGLIGALIAFLLRRRDRLVPQAKALLSQLVLWAGINSFLGLTIPGIDNAAHMGGAVAGLLLGFVVRDRRPQYAEPV